MVDVNIYDVENKGCAKLFQKLKEISILA